MSSWSSVSKITLPSPNPNRNDTAPVRLVAVEGGYPFDDQVAVSGVAVGSRGVSRHGGKRSSAGSRPYHSGIRSVFRCGSRSAIFQVGGMPRARL